LRAFTSKTRSAKLSVVASAPHAGQQLLKREGFHEIIISAAIQAAHAILHRIPRREHQHLAGPFGRPQRLQHLKAIFFRQHHIKDDEVISMHQRQIEPLFAIKGRIHCKMLLPQPALNEAGHLGFILDDQQAHKMNLGA
jgi:hypothetical protein